MKKLNKKGKKIVLSVTALVLVAAIGLGIWFGTRGSSDPVSVFHFDQVGMTEFWGDSQESYGPVTTDRIQTVFLTDTQTVTEVKVKEGDTVKKGDILLSFDTTLSDLQLERKRLEAEKEKLQLEAAKTELRKIGGLKPMTPMDDSDFEIPEPPQGTELLEPYKAYVFPGHDGKSMGGAFVCRLRTDTTIDSALLEALRRQVWGDVGICEHGNWGETCDICNPPPCIHGLKLEDCPVCALKVCEHGNVADLCPQCPCRHNVPRGECKICSPNMCSHGYVANCCPHCHETHTEPHAGCKFCDNGICPHFLLWNSCSMCNPPDPSEPVTDPTTAPTDPVTPDPEVTGIRFTGSEDYVIQFLSNETPDPGNPVKSFYVVFKMTEGNMDLAPNTLWQGAFVQGQGSDFSISYFTPTIEDYTLPEDTGDQEPEAPEIDFGSGFTAAEISKMYQEQQKKVKEQELKAKMAEAEYKIMQRELNDGNIYADFDGKVVSLLSEEDARKQEQPILKVSGGGGFYITGSVSELEKENLLIGQEVTVNDWRNGGTYTGTVQSIGDFPSSNDSWNGMGNPTATYYPFTAFVGEEANLQSGNYVSVQYTTSGTTNGIYLEKAFVRTEKGVSYVYVQGEDGRLEKRTVTTGKSLWGSYLEILSGVTAEDKIAFPYGKDVKEGAKTAEGDISSLYGY